MTRHAVSKRIQTVLVAGNGVVVVPSLHYRAKPPPHVRYTVVHPAAEFFLDLLQLRTHSLRHALPSESEPATLVLAAHMRETEKVKRLRSSFATAPAALDRKTAKLDQACLFGVKFQAELFQPLPQLSQEPLRLSPMLKSYSEIIRVPNDDYISGGVLLPPVVDPKVQDVMQEQPHWLKRRTCPPVLLCHQPRTASLGRWPVAWRR